MSKLYTGSAHAKLYKRFRPVYPSEVIEKIVDYRKTFRNNFRLALDLGCGSGQSTLPLSKYFKIVIGVDASQTQIDEAKTATSSHPNLQFRAGYGEDLAFQADERVDLITVAQAFHWMDTDRFYCEANRVLRPGGVVAIYGYGNMWLDHSPSSDLITMVYQQTLWDNRCRDKRGKHAKNLYMHYTPMPLDDFYRDDSLVMTQRMTVDHVIGYLSSWSSYQTFMKTFPLSTILEDIASQQVATNFIGIVQNAVA